MPSVGAITSNLNIVGVTGNYTAKANDFVNASAVSGGLTVTLPVTPATNTLVAVKKVDVTTNMVTVVPGAGATINGDTAMGLAVQGGSATLQYDGTNWQVLSTASVNSATPVGLPTGGTAGQALLKNTTSNYDAGWGAITGAIPAGGTAGQVLKKNTASSYDVAWGAASQGQAGAFTPWVGSTRYFCQPYQQGASLTPRTANAFPSFFPVYVPNACTITSIWAYLLTGSGATANFYLYTDNPAATSYGPATQLASGSVGVSSAASWSNVNVSVAVSGPQMLWVGFSCSVNLSVYGMSAVSAFNNFAPTILAAVNQWAGVQTNAAITPPANMATTACTIITGIVPVVYFTVA